MLTEICGYLKNWFVRQQCYGDFVIADGAITYADGKELPLLEGQFFCVVGSIFNDGVHRKPSVDAEADDPQTSALALPLKDESFTGVVKCMAVPQDLINVAIEITKWSEKYGGADSPAKSPFNSESFGGYSYSKNNGSGADASAGSWQGVFAGNLNRYRKL